jgi:hypothetical protein
MTAGQSVTLSWTVENQGALPTNVDRWVDSVYVANAGDGSVWVLRGDDLAPVGRVELGDDADNVRVDARRNRVLVGYGKGALAVIDPATRTKAADIRLNGHPEGFRSTKPAWSCITNAGGARYRDCRSCSGVDPIRADASGGLEFSDGDRCGGAPCSRCLS